VKKAWVFISIGGKGVSGVLRVGCGGIWGGEFEDDGLMVVSKMKEKRETKKKELIQLFLQFSNVTSSEC